jgi:hypothetical protein
VPSLQAFRRALEITLAILSKDEWEFECDPDDFEVRVFFGALAGGLMAVLERPSDVAKRMHQALDPHRGGRRQSQS